MLRDQALQLMLRKLETRAPLDEADRRVLLGLPYGPRLSVPPPLSLRESDRPERSCLILSGFAYRH